MASYNELNALIDAYINRNGVQAITGQVLNGVLKTIVEQIGRGYAMMGVATPSTDPGTPDAPETYYASTAGTYTNFDNIQLATAELAMLCYDPGTGWSKQTIYDGFAQVNATVGMDVGTPTVQVTYQNGVLSFAFDNLKGHDGLNGEDGIDGEPAGFGEVQAMVDNNVGTPSVEVTTDGPNTAKNFYFDFHNLKGIQGDTGVTSVVVTVDNTSGNPQCTASLLDQQLTLAFTGLKGAQGDTGVSADYPITIVNNLTTNDPTSALSAAQGVQLESEISQLEAEVDGIPSHTDTITQFPDTGKFLYGNGTLTSSDYNITDYIDIENAEKITLTDVYESTTGVLSYVIYDSSKNKIGSNPAPSTTGTTTHILTELPEGAKYIRCTENIHNPASIDIDFAAIPGLVGKVASLEYEDQQNKGRISDLEGDVASLDGRVTTLEENQIDIQRTLPAENVIKDFTSYVGYHLNTIGGSMQANANFTSSEFIEIDGNSKYTFGRKNKEYGGYETITAQEICYYDEDKTFVSAETSKTTITSPLTAKYLRFSVLSTAYSTNIGIDDLTEVQLAQGEELAQTFGQDIFGSIMPLNGLYGKKWLLIGDSNTEHNFRANAKYDDFISAYTGVIPTNIGKSGAGFRVYENTNYVYLNILNSFITDNPDYVPDFITIMGGTNDVNFDGSNIGTYTDETSATVFGYMYLLIERIKEVYPNVPFAICTQFPQEYGDSSKQTLLESFVEGEMDFCKYRNVPCLDLFFRSGLRPNEAGFNAHYYSCSASPTGDGIHLNYYGQRLISARIREFLLAYFGEM